MSQSFQLRVHVFLLATLFFASLLAAQGCQEPVAPSQAGEQDLGAHHRTRPQFIRSIELLRCLGILCDSPELLAAASEFDEMLEDEGFQGGNTAEDVGAVTAPDTSDDPNAMNNPGTTNCWQPGGDNAVVFDNRHWSDPSGGADPDSELFWSANHAAGDAEMASLLVHEYSHRAGDSYQWAGTAPASIPDLLAYHLAERIAHELLRRRVSTGVQEF